MNRKPIYPGFRSTDICEPNTLGFQRFFCFVFSSFLGEIRKLRLLHVDSDEERSGRNSPHTRVGLYVENKSHNRSCQRFCVKSDVSPIPPGGGVGNGGY